MGVGGGRIQMQQNVSSVIFPKHVQQPGFFLDTSRGILLLLGSLLPYSTGNVLTCF